MRNDIFYWKCDCAVSTESKKQLYFSNKHTSDTTSVAQAIACDFLGEKPAGFDRLKVDGNHFAYWFANKKTKFLLRTDDGLSNDNYMLAESAILEELNRRKLPVPKIYATNIDAVKYPVRYQIMEFIDAPSLQQLYHKNTINLKSIAKEFGLFLAELHQLKYPNFGFINTDILLKEKRFCGIDSTWADYFNKCLPKHIGYLREKKIVTGKVIQQIEKIFAQNKKLLELNEGSLLHRDFAYWNILGTSNKILAVIDWDDAVIGDPADDLGIVNCFNSPEFMENLLKSYNQIVPVDEIFRRKIHFYTLRNMLWKIMIRHYMGYFDKDDQFFLNKNELNLSLKAYSLEKIKQSINALEKI